MLFLEYSEKKTFASLVSALEGTWAYWFKKYRGADKSLARPGRKQATATEDSEFHISHL